MPKRGSRGGGGHGGGGRGGRGGRGGGGRGRGRGGGGGGQSRSKSYGGYTGDYSGDGFADDDDFISFSGRNQRHPRSTEGDIYRKIQAAKGHRGGGGNGAGGYRPPPPPPKQNSNGKNSKHFFWPHPDHHQQAGAAGSTSFSSGNNNNRGKVRRDPVQVMFNRASHLTDPSMQHRRNRNGDDDDDEDEDDDEDDDDDLELDSDDESDESDDDDLIDRGLDSDDESGDEILMQQFNWIEEETDQNRKNEARVTQKQNSKAPVVSDLISSSSVAPLEAMSSMSVLDSAMTQSEDFMGTLDDQHVYDMEAEEINRPSRPLSALSSTSVKSNGHQNKKSRTSTTNNATTTTTTTTITTEHGAHAKTTTVPLSTAGHAEEATVGWFMDTTTNMDMPMAVPVADDGTVSKEKTAGGDDAPLWFMDTTPDMNTIAELIEAEETYITLPIEEALGMNPKKKAHRSKRGGRRVKEMLKEKEKEKANKELVVGHDDDGLIYLDEQSEDEDDDMLALEDYLQNTMDPDNPDGFSSLLGALKGLHSGGMGHSNNLGGQNADDSDFDQEGSEDDSDDFDFEADYNDGYKKLNFSKVSASAKDKRKSRKADDLLREELEDLMPLWRSGALEEGDGQPRNKNKARRAKGYDTYVLDESDEEFLAGVSGRGNKKKIKNKKEPHGGSFESLMEINRTIEEFVNDRSVDNISLPPMPKPLRRKVHLLCNHYNLRSQSVGSGKRRFPVLIKTDRTRMPVNPMNVNRLLQQSENEIKSSLQQILQSQGRGNRNTPGGPPPSSKFNKGKARGGGGGSMAAPHGTVVGAEASAISTENLGHRMLAKMGWSPGAGLGASGEGIVQPIEAVMRAKRRGLGHGE